MYPSKIVIALTGDMTKTDKEWEAAAPLSLETRLRAYLDTVRPWLMRRTVETHQMLWVGRMGKPLAYGTMKNSIPMVTKRELQVSISPHLFRDAAATTLARQSPADTRLIRPLLGHSSDRIAEKHYNHAKRIEAGRNYAKLLTQLTEGE